MRRKGSRLPAGRKRVGEWGVRAYGDGSTFRTVLSLPSIASTGELILFALPSNIQLHCMCVCATILTSAIDCETSSSTKQNDHHQLCRQQQLSSPATPAAAAAAAAVAALTHVRPDTDAHTHRQMLVRKRERRRGSAMDSWHDFVRSCSI